MTRTEIINHYIKINGYKSYLEIGVYDKKNFNAIQCKRKVSVDPDPKAMADFQLTSDDFFANNREFFDCIFIDGLHHAYQVIRDIQNSLGFLSENGTIIVHDCNPTSEEMQIIPRATSFWTGDVWRAWLHFRTKPYLEMFVHDCDFGVGVIRRGKQNPIEVSNPTYQGFEANKQNWLPLVPPPSEISVVIPTYDQRGLGKKYLRELLLSLRDQQNVLFEVCISDNGDMSDVIAEFSDLNIRYQKSDRHGVAENTNAAISMASCRKIKIMYQDDLLATSKSLFVFNSELDRYGWVISGSKSIDRHSKIKKMVLPYWSDLEFRRNLTGMPSVIAFNRCAASFDTSLKTFLDLDFYHQLNKIYGPPGLVKYNLVCQRYHDASQSRNQEDMRAIEQKILEEKHKP